MGGGATAADIYVSGAAPVRTDADCPESDVRCTLLLSRSVISDAYIEFVLDGLSACSNSILVEHLILYFLGLPSPLYLYALRHDFGQRPRTVVLLKFKLHRTSH